MANEKAIEFVEEVRRFLKEKKGDELDFIEQYAKYFKQTLKYLDQALAELAGQAAWLEVQQKELDANRDAEVKMAGRIEQLEAELARQPKAEESDAVKILEKRYKKSVAQIAIEQEGRLDQLEADKERLEEASDKLGAWMSAALEDDKVCKEMKVDIREWFEALKPAHKKR